MAKITVKHNGVDVNGNTKYLYNFIFVNGEGEISYNDQFKIIGRKTKKGISSTKAPSEVAELLQDYLGFIMNLPCNENLGNAQKVIDRCNGGRGCNKLCNKSSQDNCWRLNAHREQLNISCNANEFRFVEIEEVE